MPRQRNALGQTAALPTPRMEPPPPRPPRDAGASASPSSDAAFVAASGPFCAPVRRIASPFALASYAASPARADLLGFVRALAEAVRGVTLTEQVPESPAVAALVGVLDELEARPAPRAPKPPALSAPQPKRRAGWQRSRPLRRRCATATQHTAPGVRFTTTLAR